MQLLNRIWQLAISKKNNTYQLIDNPKRCWLADPFFVEYDNQLYIFAEKVDRVRQKGVIACSEFAEGKKLKWETVLEEPFHMSFPNIYLYNEKLYMLPETAESNCIKIYKAKSFPHEWEEVFSQKMDGKYVDSVLAEIENEILLLSYNLTNKSLDLFRYVEEINKIELCGRIADVETTLRPAGKTFYKGKDLILPTQNCNGEYGRSIRFAKITKNKNEFCYILEPEEIEPSKLRCNRKKWCGCHTYNVSEKYNIIDVKYIALDPIAYIGRINNKIRKRRWMR